MDEDCATADECRQDGSCVDGECVLGDFVCDEFDAENCACAVLPEGGCGVVGVDSDEDGHRSSACEANPGSDCNDDNATVYPGAEELCDGLDNDCDTLRDLDDGLVPWNQTVDVGPAIAGDATNVFDISWSADSGQYVFGWIAAIAASGGPQNWVQVATVRPDGTLTHTLKNLIFARESYSGRFSVESGFGETAVGITVDGEYVVQRIGATGTSTLGPAIHVALPEYPISVSLVRPNETDWLVVWGKGGEAFVTRIRNGAIDESVVGKRFDGADGFGADASDSLLVPWPVSYQTTSWTALDSSLAPVAQQRFSEGSQLAGEPGQTLPFVDSTAETHTFSVYAADGFVCENIALPGTGHSPAAIVPNRDGWLYVASINTRYALESVAFTQVYPDCTTNIGAPVTDLEPAGWPTKPRTAGSLHGSAVGYAAKEPESGENFFRILLNGPGVCDPHGAPQ